MSDQVDKVYRKGLLALSRGKAKEARKIADQLAKLRCSGAYEIGARAHWQAGETDEALQMLRAGVNHFPQVAILWSYLGDFLSNMGQYDEAIDAFERSAEGLNGSRMHADYNIANVQWRAGNYSRVLEILDGIADDPPWEAVQELRAMALVDLRRFEEALPVLYDLAESRPKEITARDLAFMIGLFAETHLGLGDHEEALSFAKQCLELDPKDVRGLRVMSLLPK